MPGKQSAGLLVYRRRSGALEVFLVHPGGPFWQSRDLGAWCVPKGELARDADPLDAARREFVEETGFEMSGDFLSLAPIRQPGGKTIHACGRRRLCPRGDQKQHVRDRMAAALGPHPGVPRG